MVTRCGSFLSPERRVIPKKNIYIKPSKVLGLPATALWKLLKPLNGVCDSGDYCFITFAWHVTHELGMRSILTDKAMLLPDDTKCPGVMAILLMKSLPVGMLKSQDWPRKRVWDLRQRKECHPFLNSQEVRCKNQIVDTWHTNILMLSHWQSYHRMQRSNSTKLYVKVNVAMTYKT